MNVPDEPLPSNPGPGPGHVNQIRQQWVLHEDEALAYKLQKEEITQHYSGNRTRNALVREDVPKAREEQEREEREALSERLKKLRLLQLQAEEDARIAKIISESDSTASVPGATVVENHDLDFDILDNESAIEANGQVEDGGAMGFTPKELSLEELKRLQEERDEELARKLQEELEQVERDKQLAIEAQDREMAKMLYVKEKAKIKRAKERARLKAEAAASSSSGAKSDESAERNLESSLNRTGGGGSDTNSSSGSIELRSPLRRELSYPVKNTPPKLPEKSKSVDVDDPVRFRAASKPLPPQPQSATSPSRRYAKPQDEPVPPYMPMHGFNIQNKKK